MPNGNGRRHPMEIDRKRIARDIDYHIQCSEEGICRIPRQFMLQLQSALTTAPSGGKAATAEPGEGAIEFGLGKVVLADGEYNGKAAVFIAPAKYPGAVGEDAEREGNPKDAMVPGEIAFMFQTKEHAALVLDALYNRSSPAPPSAQPSKGVATAQLMSAAIGFLKAAEGQLSVAKIRVDGKMMTPAQVAERLEQASMDATEIWADIEHLLIEECGLLPDEGLGRERVNCIAAITPALFNATALPQPSKELVERLLSRAEFEDNGGCAERTMEDVGSLLREAATALSQPSSSPTALVQEIASYLESRPGDAHADKLLRRAMEALGQPPVTDAGKGWEEAVWRTRKTYPPKWIYTDSVKQSADWKRREREVEVFYRARTEATEEKPLPSSEGDEA